MNEFINTLERELRCSSMLSENFNISGDQPQYLSDREFETSHIKITCEFDVPRKRVLGSVEITLKPYHTGLERIRLDSEDTEIRKITLGGDELQYEQCGRDLTIILKQPARTRDELVVKIDYAARPQKGLYFTGADEAYKDKPTQIWTQGQDTDNHHWFPCVDEPKGRITSEVICTVPGDWTVLSNGRLVSATDNGKGGKVFHWLQDKPHSVYLITLVAGVFTRVVLQDADPPIDFYCAPGREEDAHRSFENTVGMIKFFSELTGEPYPWDKYSQIAVQDFIFGGMENTSATTQTDMTLHDERAHKDFSSDYLVAHEAAHQWFGDLITCREWPHAWLNEGFATFLEALWQEHHRGRDEYLWDIYSMSQIHMAESYKRPIVERRYSDPIDIFDRHLYEKGALVLHMLRNELGEDKFYEAIRHYVRQNRNRNVVTPDLQRAIEETTGRTMDWFFDQWVFGKGQPDFKVDYTWDSAEKTAILNVSQTQKDIFRCGVEVAFLFEGERKAYKMDITKKQQTLRYVFKSQPQAVQFDAGFGILKSLTFKRPRAMLIYQLANDTDMAGRLEAAKALGRETSPEAVEALAEVLASKTEFYGVQVVAAEALGKIRTADARDVLIKHRKMAHLKARRSVAAALGNFRHDKAAAKALEGMLNSSDSYYVSAAAGTSLGRVRVDGAYKDLASVLGRPSHRDVISAGALLGMGNLESDEAMDKVCEWTRRGYPQTARIGATTALGNNLGHSERRRAIETLSGLLDDGWFQVRVAAIGALEALEAREAIPALRRLVEREVDARAARLARKAISKLIDKGTSPEKIKKLQDELDELRQTNSSILERLDKLEKS